MTDADDREIQRLFAELAAAMPEVRAGRFFGMEALLVGRVPLAFLDRGDLVVRRSAVPATFLGKAWVDPRGRTSAGWAVTAARGETLVELLHHLTPGRNRP